MPFSIAVLCSSSRCRTASTSSWALRTSPVFSARAASSRSVLSFVREPRFVVTASIRSRGVMIISSSRGLPLLGHSRIDLGEVLVAHAPHPLLQPFGDLGAVEAELAADFLARNLPLLGHALHASHIGAQHAGHFLDRQGSVGHGVNFKRGHDHTCHITRIDSDPRAFLKSIRERHRSAMSSLIHDPAQDQYRTPSAGDFRSIVVSVSP